MKPAIIVVPKTEGVESAFELTRSEVQMWSKEIAATVRISENNVRLALGELQGNAILHGQEAKLIRLPLQDGSVLVIAEDTRYGVPVSRRWCQHESVHGTDIIRAIVGFENYRVLERGKLVLTYLRFPLEYARSA